jgi:hypothetical protein
MPLTNNYNWDIPEKGTKPYHAAHVTLFNQIDATVYGIDTTTTSVYVDIGTASAPGALRGATGAAGSIAFAQGFWTANDGGGGYFHWVVDASPPADNGGTIIVPSGTPGGYWQRANVSSVYNVKWFGADKGQANNSLYFNSLLSFIGSDPATILIPNDTDTLSSEYTLTTNVSFPANVKVVPQPGAKFDISTGVTLTFAEANNLVASPIEQLFIFSGTAALSFTRGGDAYIGWTGGKGDGSTNNTIPLEYLVKAFDGTSGRVLLPWPNVDYLFNGDTIDLKGDVVLEGMQPATPIELGGAVFINNELAATATTLAANANRRDKSITVTSATGIQTGDTVWVYTSGVDADTSWNYKKTDLHVVDSVSGSVVNLATPLNFDYLTSDSGQQVTVYRPHLFSLKNLNVKCTTSTTYIRLTGCRNARVDACRFYDPDRSQDLTPIQIYRCIDTYFDNFTVDGVLYGAAVQQSRNFVGTKIKCEESRTSIEPATYTDGFLIDGLYCHNTYGGIFSHPAFNVTYKNCQVYCTGPTGDLQAIGVTIENVYIESTVASSTNAVLISFFNLVDTSIWDEYKVTLKDVEWNFPNWEHTQDPDDRVNIGYSRAAVLDNVKAPYLQCQVAFSPDILQINNCELIQLRSRTDTFVSNTRFKGDDSSGSYALWFEQTRAIEFNNCYFEDYDELIGYSPNLGRPHSFSNCVFTDISSLILNNAGSPGSDFIFHFANCTFNSVPATWSSPEVLNNNLKLTNIRFVSTNPKLDFISRNVAVVDIPGGIKDIYALTWQNPNDHQIMVDRVVIQITTAGGTAGALMDVGVSPDASTQSDIILDGIDLNPGSPPVEYDSMNPTDIGTNGVQRAVVLDANGGTNDWITGKIIIQNATSLVAKAYIEFHRI